MTEKHWAALGRWLATICGGLVLVVAGVLIPRAFQSDLSLEASIYPARYVSHAGYTCDPVGSSTDCLNQFNFSRQLDGLILLNILNDGDVVARNVRVFIRGAAKYAVLDESGIYIEIDHTSDGVILNEISQKRSVNLVAWTTRGERYSNWQLFEDDFIISFEDGFSDINFVIPPVSPFYLFFDRRGNLEMLLALLFLIIVVASIASTYSYVLKSLRQDKTGMKES